jgi:hypothetical protein
MPTDRGNAKHGPSRDDAMAHDVEGYVRARRDTRAEEWRSAEPPAEESPATAARPDGGRRGSAPPGMTLSDVEERSELARWLGRAVFPADRDEVLDHLRHQNAPEHVVQRVGAAPDDTLYGSLGELWRALHHGEHVESRRY